VINCASIYPAVMLRPGHRKNRALGPASLEGGQGLVGGRRRWGGRRAIRSRIGFSRGRQHLLISAKRQRRCRNAPLPNGDRAWGLCDPVDLWA
jgi:hypothetical protein